jgi:hypothetical protein
MGTAGGAKVKWRDRERGDGERGDRERGDGERGGRENEE